MCRVQVERSVTSSTACGWAFTSEDVGLQPHAGGAGCNKHPPASNLSLQTVCRGGCDKPFTHAVWFPLLERSIHTSCRQYPWQVKRGGPAYVKSFPVVLLFSRRGGLNEVRAVSHMRRPAKPHSVGLGPDVHLGRFRLAPPQGSHDLWDRGHPAMCGEGTGFVCRGRGAYPLWVSLPASTPTGIARVWRAFTRGAEGSAGPRAAGGRTSRSCPLIAGCVRTACGTRRVFDSGDVWRARSLTHVKPFALQTGEGPSQTGETGL